MFICSIPTAMHRSSQWHSSELFQSTSGSFHQPCQHATLQIGGTWYDATQMNARADEIAAWGNALAQDGDLLFYGCELASNASVKHYDVSGGVDRSRHRRQHEYHGRLRPRWRLDARLQVWRNRLIGPHLAVHSSDLGIIRWCSCAIQHQPQAQRRARHWRLFHRPPIKLQRSLAGSLIFPR